MKNMKQLLSILMLVTALFVTPEASAQKGGNIDGKGRKERIAQLKIAFITKELDLTTDEAEKFWPLYNEMSSSIKKERKTRKEKTKTLKANYETSSEADIKKATGEILDSQINEVTIRKDYMDKIAKVITYKKAVKLLSIEQKFKQELLNQLNERRGGSQNGQRSGQRTGQRGGPNGGNR